MKIDEYSCKRNRRRSYVYQLTVTKKKLYKIVKKREELFFFKNQQSTVFSAEKNYKGTWSAILRCFNQWIKQPNDIPDLLTQGRTVLLSKIEYLYNERNYHPITCLRAWLVTPRNNSQKEIKSGTKTNWECALEFWEL